MKGFQVLFTKNYSKMYKYNVELLVHEKDGSISVFIKYLGNSLKAAKKEARYIKKIYNADDKRV